MGLFSFFSKKPEDLLKSGDELFEKKQYAPAVRDYEKALDKHQKDPTIPDFNKMVSKKIASAKKALAHQHIETARTLMESRCFEDATELLNLAMELSDSSAVSDTVKALLEEIQTAEASQISEESDYRYEETYEDDPDDPDTFSEADFDDSEYAFALFSSMPEEEQAAYQDYGQAFIRGFVALNQGDFERAADYLKMALDENTSENPDQKTYIPLELGTAYLNLGELEKAKDLLEKFLADFPMSEKGYQIYCEILWGLKEYEHALALLQDCPEALSQTALITYLTGETHAQTENPDAAITTYKKYLERNAEEEVILRALGNLYEKPGKPKVPKPSMPH